MCVFVCLCGGGEKENESFRDLHDCFALWDMHN